MESNGIPWYRKVVYLALPWLVVAGLAEGATRILRDAPKSGRRMFQEITMSEPHPRRVWQYKANYRQRFQTEEFAMEIETNSVRLRDEEPNPKATIRILAIGDSFTFGWGVAQAERYTEVLETELQRLYPDERVEVLNAGHFNYSFDQQAVTLEEFVDSYRPHVVLQGVYPGHVLSIREHGWEPGTSGELTTIVYEDRTRAIRVTKEGVLRRTNLWIEEPPLGSRFIAKLLQRYFRMRQIEETVEEAVWLYEPGRTEMAEAWSKTRRAVARSAELARTHNAVHVVFDVPQNVQVDRAEWPEYFTEGAEGRELDMDYPTTVFEAATRDAGSEWVSLLPVFREGYRPSLYFPRDPHWTGEGHVLAARALVPVVERAIESTR